MLRTTSAWDGDNPSLPDLSLAAGQHPWHWGWILRVSVGKGPCGSTGLCPGSCASLPDRNLNFGQNQPPVPSGIISLAACGINCRFKSRSKLYFCFFSQGIKDCSCNSIYEKLHQELGQLKRLMASVSFPNTFI